MTTLYVGFNDTHLTEKLTEEHGLAVSREAVRRLRRALGRPPQRARRPPRARRLRVPEAARGSLVQIDGSPFAGSVPPPRPSCFWVPSTTPPTDILALHFRPTEEVTAEKAIPSSSVLGSR